MKRLTALVLITAACVAWLILKEPPVPLQAASDEALLSLIMERQEQVSMFEAQYRTVWLFLSGEKQVRAETGRYFKKGTRVRKEVVTPAPKVVITTDRFAYEKDLNSGIVRQVDYSMDTVTPEQIRRFTPTEALYRFNLTLTGETAAHYLFTGHYQTMQVHLAVDKRLLLIERMAVHLHTEEASAIAAVSVTYNKTGRLPVLQQTDTTLMSTTPRQETAMRIIQYYDQVRLTDIPEEKFALTDPSSI